METTGMFVVARVMLEYFLPRFRHFRHFFVVVVIGEVDIVRRLDFVSLSAWLAIEIDAVRDHSIRRML